MLYELRIIMFGKHRTNSKVFPVLITFTSNKRKKPIWYKR